MPLDHTQAPHAEHEETAAERTARHLRVCRRIIELSMSLTEAAFKNAKEQLVNQPKPKPATPSNAKQPTPHQPTQKPKDPHEQALHRLEATFETLASPEPAALAEPAQPCSAAAALFHRLSALTISAVALERQIAKEAAHEAAARPIWRSPDPRRPVLTRALHTVTRYHTHAAALRREMEERLDEELRANQPSADIILKICRGYGIDVNEVPPFSDGAKDLQKILNAPPEDTG